MKYPLWFDFGFYSGNPYSSVVVDAEGNIEIPEVVWGGLYKGPG